MHTSKSGVAHFSAQTEEDAIQMIQKLLSYIPQNNLREPPVFKSSDPIDRLEDGPIVKLFPAVPTNPTTCMKLSEALSTVENFWKCMLTMQNIIVGFARFNGQSVGIVANQPKFLIGVLDINASRKAARFVRFCDAFNIPIVSLVDVPGFPS